VKKLWIILLASICIFNLKAHDFVKKGVLEDYCFILLMPSNNSAGYSCAVFVLEDLKVCRFPGGPVWSNTLLEKDLHQISQETYFDIKQMAHKLDILCLDYQNFKLDCPTNDLCHVCGFALPWESGMAYVFDNLTQIDQVTGLIIEKTELVNLKLCSHFKKSECNNYQIEIAEYSDNNLDSIDLLMQGDNDQEYATQPLSDTAQKLKNFFGKIAIFCLMGYHDIKLKITRIIKDYYA
jgi:hypothetical protein